jgi:hypothetical protein
MTPHQTSISSSRPNGKSASLIDKTLRSSPICVALEGVRITVDILYSVTHCMDSLQQSLRVKRLGKDLQRVFFQSVSEKEIGHVHMA